MPQKVANSLSLRSPPFANSVSGTPYSPHNLGTIYCYFPIPVFTQLQATMNTPTDLPPQQQSLLQRRTQHAASFPSLAIPPWVGPPLRSTPGSPFAVNRWPFQVIPMTTPYCYGDTTHQTGCPTWQTLSTIPWQANQTVSTLTPQAMLAVHNVDITPEASYPDTVRPSHAFYVGPCPTQPMQAYQCQRLDFKLNACIQLNIIP